MAEDLTPFEREMIEAHRKAQAAREPDLPTFEREDLKVRLKLHAGHGNLTAERALVKIDYMTRRYPGPRVIVNSTLSRLKSSWAAHIEHLMKTGKSGTVIFNHRRALNAYLRAIENDWRVESTPYERRSRAGRQKRAQAGIQLPDDWVPRLASIVNDVQYHKDPAVNALFQHRARLGLFTAPRFPSEDSRLMLDHVHMPKNGEDGSLVYMTSKTSGPEGDLVLIPRDVFGLGPYVLTQPTRKTWFSWVTRWRPKIEAAARYRDLPVTPHAWILPTTGTVPEPESYRQDFAAAAKEAWPGFYGYMLRELGIITRALFIVQERGHIDLELLSQWSSHDKLDNLRGYMRKARSILRTHKPGPQLNALLAEIRSI